MRSCGRGSEVANATHPTDRKSEVVFTFTIKNFHFWKRHTRSRIFDLNSPAVMFIVAAAQSLTELFPSKRRLISMATETKTNKTPDNEPFTFALTCGA